MTRVARLVGLVAVLAGAGCAALDDYYEDDEYDHHAEYRREARPANDRTQPGVYSDGKQ
jgi:hypothetical protein